MKKLEILKKFIDSIEAELQILKKSAQDTADYATHSENKPENKYDTRGLEASYLAGAQAKRVAEMHDVLVAFHHQLKHPSQGSRIVIGSLVKLIINEKTNIVLVMIAGGGQSITFEGQSIQVVTPASPIGSALLGKSSGDSFSILSGGTEKEYEIVAVE